MYFSYVRTMSNIIFYVKFRCMLRVVSHACTRLRAYATHIRMHLYMQCYSDLCFWMFIFMHILIYGCTYNQFTFVYPKDCTCMWLCIYIQGIALNYIEWCTCTRVCILVVCAALYLSPLLPALDPPLTVAMALVAWTTPEASLVPTVGTVQEMLDTWMYNSNQSRDVYALVAKIIRNVH